MSLEIQEIFHTSIKRKCLNGQNVFWMNCQVMAKDSYSHSYENIWKIQGLLGVKNSKKVTKQCIAMTTSVKLFAYVFFILTYMI